MLALKEISMVFWCILILGQTDKCIMIASASAVNVEKLMEQGSTFGCSSDAECAFNEFCGGKKRRCIECFDCSKKQRLPKKGYDGAQGCATNTLECGGCNPGFDEYSGECIERDPAKKTTENVKYLAGYDTPLNPTSKPHIIEEGKVSLVVYIIVFSLLAVVALIIFIATIIRFNITSNFSKQASGSSFEEENGLTSEDDPASAPPAEYQRQPAYIPFTYNYRPTTSPNRVQQAIPFNTGNGAGNWIVPHQDDDDAVDGIEESSIIESQNPPISAPVANIVPENANGNNILAGQDGPGLPQGNGQILQHSENGNDGSDSSEGNSNSENVVANVTSSGEPFIAHDSVLGYLRFNAFGLVQIQGNGRILNPGPGNNGGSTDAAGSSGSFDNSNTSIDSGTGVSESLQVPSRSDSRSGYQGMSDPDDYDDEMFPESPQAVESQAQPLMAPPPLEMDLD